MTIHSDNTTMGNGFVLMHRCIKQHWIWSNPKYFQWWLDLIMEANFADKQILVGRKPTTLKRGQLIASLSWLMEEFDVKKKNCIIDFLRLLEEHKMITRVTKHKVTIITICNYEKYQIPLPLEENIMINRMVTDVVTNKVTDVVTDVVTQNNKGNKGNEILTPPNISNDTLVPLTGANKKSPEKRREEMDKRMESARQEFYNSLIPYVTTYGKEMVREFFDYWTEPNKSRSKMRFEQQKTWDTPRRLAYWSNRDSARTHRSSEPVIQY